MTNMSKGFDAPGRTRRNLILFTLVVLLSGWVGQGLNRLAQVPSAESPGMLLWLVAPLAATLLLRAFAGDGWKDMGLRPLLRGNLPWYLVALLVYPVLTMLSLGIGLAAGWIALEGFRWSVFAQAFLVALIPNFIKNIPEEFVWRGYLTPKLDQLGVPDRRIYLLVGLIWGLWHLPYYLFFLEPEVIGGFTAMPLAPFIGITLLAMLAWTIVFVEIWFLTRSIWPAVLMHMVEDAFVNPLVLDPAVVIDPSRELWSHPATGLVSILLYTLLGLALRHIRLRKRPATV